MRFGSLVQEADPNVYDKCLELVRHERLMSSFTSNEILDILEWAVDKASFKRLHYGHSEAVNLWSYLQ